jgi:hypothetical protein
MAKDAQGIGSLLSERKSALNSRGSLFHAPRALRWCQEPACFGDLTGAITEGAIMRATRISLSWCPAWVISTSFILLMTLTLPAHAASISRFVGTYTGSASVVSADGSKPHRNMNVIISESKKNFTVEWTSTTVKSDGRVKEKSYSINFTPSDRDGIYAAAMEQNLFGKSVQLDPMKGEPYVWGRIAGDTLSVFSLFVNEGGGYEMQQYDRTLADGGLQLDFTLSRNGEELRSVSAFLKRQ